MKITFTLWNEGYPITKTYDKVKAFEYDGKEMIIVLSEESSKYEKYAEMRGIVFESLLEGQENLEITND